MNNSESKKRLLALQKSKFLSVEIQDALRFAIEKLSDGEYQDSQIRPDGHFKFPHLWPVKLPHGRTVRLCRI